MNNRNPEHIGASPRGLTFALMVLSGLLLTSCHAQIQETQCKNPVEMVSTDGQHRVVLNTVCGNSIVSARLPVTWDLDDIPDGVMQEGQMHGRAIVSGIRNDQDELVGCDISSIILQGDITDSNYALWVEKEGLGHAWACDQLARAGWLGEFDSRTLGWRDDETDGLAEVIPTIDAGGLVYMWKLHRADMLNLLNPPQEVIDLFDKVAEGPLELSCELVQLTNILAANRIIGNDSGFEVTDRACGNFIQQYLNMPIDVPALPTYTPSP